MIMHSPYHFKNINVGDLLIQQVIDPLKDDSFIRRRGIIVNIQNNVSTIEWTTDGSDFSNQMTSTSILNSSLRKMIMNGYILHYPVQK
jgi:hypothetical protein